MTRRLARRCFNGVTLLSLLLCVATLLTLVRSYITSARWRREIWDLNRHGNVIVTGSFWGFWNGTFFYGKDFAELSKPTNGWYPEMGERRCFEQQPASGSSLFWITDGSKGNWAYMNTRKSARFVYQKTPGSPESTLIGAPIWIFILILAILPIWRSWYLFQSLRALRRSNAGLCPICTSVPAPAVARSAARYRHDLPLASN
jgi:hypothetical protein